MSMGSAARPTHSSNDDAQEDNWDRALRKSGCEAENEALLDCKTRTRDWRMCRQAIADLAECLKKQQQQQRQEQ